jgi:hypothetical protein
MWLVEVSTGSACRAVTWPVALTNALKCRLVTGVRSIQEPSTAAQWLGASSG